MLDLFGILNSGESFILDNEQAGCFAALLIRTL